MEQLNHLSDKQLNHLSDGQLNHLSLYTTPLHPDNYEISYNILTNVSNEDDSKYNEYKDYLKNKLSQLFGQHLTYLSYFASEASDASDASELVKEIGPLANFESPWSTNVKSILRNCGIIGIEKIEMCKRMLKYHSFDYDKVLEQVYPHSYKFYPPNPVVSVYPVNNINEFSLMYGLTFDDIELSYYKSELYPNREPTNVELFDLAQSNSEHSRHWIFKGQLHIKDQLVPQSLFKTIKRPWEYNKRNSVIAFCDDASAIDGYSCNVPYIDDDCRYKLQTVKVYPSFTAETHNFPTTFAPFPGANTGVGGRIRDNQAVGRGGQLIAGTAGYSVLASSEHDKLLIDASNGASDYGNKIGEPIIQGFSRRFGTYTPLSSAESQYYGYSKCIMFTGGIGQILQTCNITKMPPRVGMHIVRIGGPAYRIGLGGGTASSRSVNSEVDMSAVQRGDPEMANKVNRVLRKCYEDPVKNIILNIHDQGAGGMANVTKEIVSPLGATVYLSRVPLGDTSLSDLEIWCAEYQEQLTVLIEEKDVFLLQSYCILERVPMCDIGVVNDSGNITVIGRNDQDVVVDINLEKSLEKIPQKDFEMEPRPKFSEIPFSNSVFSKTPNNVVGSFEELSEADIHNGVKKMSEIYSSNEYFKSDLNLCIYNVLSNPTVGSKRYLTSKVDRSVTGLIAQQQCVGPFHTPLSDVCVVANTHYGTTGIASSIGEQPIKSLFSSKVMVRLTIAEMLTNLVWARITYFEDIKCSGNWMWPLKCGKELRKDELHQLYLAVNETSDVLQILKIAIDGGKDSLSMYKDNTKSPETLVMSAYVTCPDITQTITPEFKRPGNKLIYIPLGVKKYGLGGTIFAETRSQLCNDYPPDINDWVNLRNVFEWIQLKMTTLGRQTTNTNEPNEPNEHSPQQTQQSDAVIVSGHDISDGGLITTLCEMAIASQFGFEITLPYELIQPNESNESNSYEPIYRLLFSEEPGLIIEVNDSKCPSLVIPFNHYYIGTVTNNSYVQIKNGDNVSIYKKELNDLQMYWETHSKLRDFDQTLACCVESEYNNIKNKREEINWTIPLSLQERLLHECLLHERFLSSVNRRNKGQGPKVGIIREEGSNGDREMSSVFHMAGFQTFDLTMSELSDNSKWLRFMDGIVFVGGFSYSDCLGAGRGWASVIQNNDELRKAFDDFRNREDTFSLGVCNGCQMMSLLGWIGKYRFVENTSGRFESRFPTVRVNDSKSIMFKGMSGMSFGIWSSHGEGKLVSSDDGDDIPEDLVTQGGVVGLQYVDKDGVPTEDYPHNPNGSPFGITALCSEDGRHLAMMPHPERSFLNWQLPWIPSNVKLNLKNVSPWFLMFKNAYDWSVQKHQQRKKTKKTKIVK
jgi:phosphoribosylformylglycinamidine synthase